MPRKNAADTQKKTRDGGPGKKKRNKGGRPQWATEEQTEWLTTQIPAFTASRSNHVADFWAAVEGEWFERWPIDALTADERKEKLTLERKVKDKKKVSIVNDERSSISYKSRIANSQLV
jgi:transposase